MQTLTQIKALLEERGLRPKHALGQNFLIDQNLVRKLAESAAIVGNDLVLEIGPGTGVLTEELLRRGCRVVAVELDGQLAELLRERIPLMLETLGVIDTASRFRLVNADCLARGVGGERTLNPLAGDELARAMGEHPASPPALPSLSRGFKLVANLPYGAATPLLGSLLIDFPTCGVMAVTIQKELGERLSATPGTKDYGPISVLAQLACRVSKLCSAPPECFWPRPDVTSALWLLERRTEVGAPSRESLRAVGRACEVLFAHRRKQLAAVLRAATKRADQPLPAWDELVAQPGCGEIDPMQRAEQLTPAQWLALSAWWQR